MAENTTEPEEGYVLGYVPAPVADDERYLGPLNEDQLRRVEVAFFAKDLLTTHVSGFAGTSQLKPITEGGVVGAGGGFGAEVMTLAEWLLGEPREQIINAAGEVVAEV